MKSNKWFYLVGIALLVLGFLILRPVQIPAEKDCLIAKGIVTRIYEGGTHDVVFQLKDHSTQFYLNRGTERGLDVNKLQNELLDKEIVIKYPNHWTPLDPSNTFLHASKVEFNDMIVFTELVK